MSLSRIASAWILLPAILYFFVAFANCPNIPILDDYDAILKWLHDWRHAGNWSRVVLIFQQHNEHRIVFTRIMTLAYYGWTGHINFRALMLISDLQLIAIAMVGIFLIRRVVIKYWQAVAFVWVLLVFDLNTYENGSIAMYGMQNYSVLMLFFCGVYFYRTGHVTLGGICQALCIFSSGNGILGAIFIALSACSHHKKSAVVSAIVMPLGALYFLFYQTGPAHTINLGKSVIYFISMLGAPFSFDNAMPCGLLVIVMLLLNFPYKKFWKDKELWPLICILGFLLGSMVTIALFRGAAADAQYQTSRYLIYPQLVIAVLAVFTFSRYTIRRGWALFAGLPILLVTYGYNFQFGRAAFERMANRAETRQYYYPQEYHEYVEKVARTACEENIYCLDDER